jgi:hypothetical protein
LQVTTQLEQLYYAVSEKGSRDDGTSKTSSSYAQPAQRTGSTKAKGDGVALPPPVPNSNPKPPVPKMQPLSPETISEVGPEPSSSSFAKAAKKTLMAKLMKKSGSFKSTS